MRVLPVLDLDEAAITSCPGAESSGFFRPSRVGPALENQERGRAVLWASYEPTTIVFCPQEIDPMVWVLSSGCSKVYCPLSSRSIHAW